MGRRVLRFDGPLARGLWYRRFTAMSFICRLPVAVVTGLTFPPDTVILSRRRRILVRGAVEAISINTGQREGCRLAARSALRIISTCHVVHPLPLRGIPLKGTQDVTGLASCPHSHSERSEESWYAAYLRQSALNTGQREAAAFGGPPLSRFAGLLLKGSMSLDSQSPQAPYESSSFATPQAGAEQSVLRLEQLMSSQTRKALLCPFRGKWWRQPPKGARRRRRLYTHRPAGRYLTL